jgi:DNA-binding CsgD family transcriptional regulator
MSRAKLVWHEREPPKWRNEPLPEPGPLLMGRREPATIQIGSDRTVSRTHARLVFVEAAWVIDDLDSTGGTFVVRGLKRRKVVGSFALRHGDHIELGRTRITYHCPPESHEDETELDPDGPPITLTLRQTDVLNCICANGAEGPWPTNAEIAEKLTISVDTVRSHLRVLYREFRLDDGPPVPDIQRKPVLARRAIEMGWAGS